MVAFNLFTLCLLVNLGALMFEGEHKDPKKIHLLRIRMDFRSKYHHCGSRLIFKAPYTLDLENKDKNIKMHYLKGLPALFFIFALNLANGQSPSEPDRNSNHRNSLFELGISTGAVRVIEGRHTTAGLHAHITRRINPILPFIIGLGYEFIIDEHSHHAFAVVLGYLPIEDLLVSISPGIINNAGVIKFTSHVEITYGFDIAKNLHLGPLVEYAYSKQDNHITVGLHLGILINKKYKD